MYLMYFALWVIFNGRWTTEIAVFGLVLAAILYVFTCKFLGLSLRADLMLVRGVLSGIRYIGVLIGEIAKANIAVARMIVNSGAEPKPQLVRFKTPLKNEGTRFVLAQSITLTPGTITLEQTGDEYLVHCLDEQMIDGLTDGVMVQALCEMEEKK